MTYVLDQTRCFREHKVRVLRMAVDKEETSSTYEGRKRELWAVSKQVVPSGVGRNIIHYERSRTCVLRPLRHMSPGNL